MGYFSGFAREFGCALAVVRLDRVKTAAVLQQGSATKWGIFILAVPPFVNLVLGALTFPSGFGAIFSKFLFWPMVVPVLSLVGAIFAMALVVKKGFGGRADSSGLFRVLSYASIVLWLSVVPFLLDVLGLSLGNGLYNLLWFLGLMWIFVVAYQVLHAEWRLSQRDTAVCLVAGVLAYFLVNLFLGRILVGKYYRVFY